MSLIDRFDDLESDLLPFRQLEELRKLVMSGELRQEIYNEIHRIQVSKFADAKRRAGRLAASDATVVNKVIRAAASSPAILTKKSFKLLSGSSSSTRRVDSRLRTPDGDVFQETYRTKGALWVCSLGKAVKRRSKAKVTWKRRELTLFDSRIEFSKRKRQSTLLWLNEDFYVDDSANLPNPNGNSHTWIVSNYETSFAFASENAEDKRKWILALDNVLRVLREFAEAPGDAPLFLDRPKRSDSRIERDLNSRMESYRESLGNEEEDSSQRQDPELVPEPSVMVEVPLVFSPPLHPVVTDSSSSLEEKKLPPSSPINSNVKSPQLKKIGSLSSNSGVSNRADEEYARRELELLNLQKEAQSLEDMKSKVFHELDNWSSEVSRLAEVMAEFEAREEELVVKETELVELSEIALDDVERFVSRETRARADLNAKEKELRETNQLIEQIDEDDEDEGASVVAVHEDDDELLAIGKNFRKARRDSVQKQEFVLSSRLQALLESDNKDKRPPSRSSDLMLKQAARPSSSRRLSLLKRRSSSNASQRASQRAQLVSLREIKEKEVAAAKRALREATDMRAASMDISQRRSDEADAAEAERVEVTAKLYAAKKESVSAQAKVAKSRHKHARVMEHYNILRVKLEKLTRELEGASSSSRKTSVAAPPKTPPSSQFDDVEDGDVEMDVLGEVEDHKSSLTSMNGTPVVLSPFGEHIRAESRKRREDSLEVPEDLRRKSLRPIGKFTHGKDRRASELERDVKYAEFEGELIT